MEAMDQRARSWLLAGALALAAVLGFGYSRGWYTPRLRRRRRIVNPWITLKRRSKSGHRQRVFIDDDGRIRKGLPATYEGVHIRDLSGVSKEIRKTRKKAAREEKRYFKRIAATFRSKDEAFAELLRANPELLTFLESEHGATDSEYRAWRRRGFRGAKPAGAFSRDDGRYDAINEYFDLSGQKAISSFTEAVYVTLPSSKRWDDLADRLPVLEEATGLRLSLPAKAEGRTIAKAERERFHAGTEEAIEALLARARRGRLSDRDDDGVPF